MADIKTSPTNDKDNDFSDLTESFAPGELAPLEGVTPLNAKKIWGDDLKKLPKKYQVALQGLVKAVANRDQYSRIQEVRRATEQRFYWRGEFGQCWNEDNQMWDSIPVNGSFSSQNSDDTNAATSYYPMNVFQAFGRGFISTIASQIPSVRFEPFDSEQIEDVEAAQQADPMRRMIELSNDMEAVVQDIARLFWTDGRVALYSRFVLDGQRFGYEDEEDGVEETQEGMTAEDGEKPEKKPRVPRGGEVVTPYGVLEVKTPVNQNRIEDFIFIQLSYEVDKSEAKGIYPDVASNIKPGEGGPGEYNYDRTSRIATMQGTRSLTQSGDTVGQLVTYQRTWLRPAAFIEVGDVNLRKDLMAMFPDGCMVAFMGETYCESRNECLDDHWTVCFPMPGDGQSKPSCGQIIVPVQDAVNDMTDLRLNCYMQIIPTVWVDEEVANLAAISQQKAEPGSHFPAKPRDGMKLEDSFFVETAPTIPGDLQQFYNDMFGNIPQFLTGIMPALFGGSDADNETLGGISILKEQARGQLATAWKNLCKAYCRAILQCVRIGAKCRTDEQPIRQMVPGKNNTYETINVEIENLRAGRFLCFPENDAAIPQTFSDKAARLQEMMADSQASPAVASLMTDPDNQMLFKEYLGFPELRVPGADSRNKQRSEIAELLKEVPIPSQEMMEWLMMAKMSIQTGRPLPPKPNKPLEASIPIDVDWDDHAIEYQTVKDWINSPAGRNAAQENPDGFMNVKLHGMDHKDQMDQEQSSQQQQAIDMLTQQEGIKAKARAMGDVLGKHGANISEKLTQGKTPNVAINYKDLGHSAQHQALAEAGIDDTADAVEKANIAQESLTGTVDSKQI